jgi:hypothetical protein
MGLLKAPPVNNSWMYTSYARAAALLAAAAGAAAGGGAAWAKAVALSKCLAHARMCARARAG